MQVLQFIIFGLGTGGFLMLATIGFTMVRRVEGFINIAHLQYISFGAYATWWVNSHLGVNIVLSAIIGIIATTILALAIAWLVYDPIREYGPVILLITSVGVAFAIQGAIEIIVPTGTTILNIGNLSALRWMGLRIGPFQLLTLIVALIAVVGLHVMLTRTRTGRQVAGISINRDLAQGRGISTGRTSRAVWAISGLTAGMAGVALGLIGTLTTDLAFEQVVLVFAVAIFAGFGSLLGVAWAALITGVAMDLSLLWLPSAFRTIIPFLIIIVVLLFRPQGLSQGGSS